MIGALIIGLFGSLHCIGMCGPVILTFMGPGQSKISFALYHGGRLLSYIFIGGILGLFGASIAFFQAQHLITLMLGVVLLFLYLIPALRHGLERFYLDSYLYQVLKSKMSRNLSMKRRWALSGVINGFFPCGLTYVAAAGAVALGSPMQGAGFMLLFGLGTIPALLFLSFSSHLVFKKAKRFMPQIVTVLAVLSGTIMVLRGMLATIPQFNQMVQANAAGLITVCGM